MGCRTNLGVGIAMGNRATGHASVSAAGIGTVGMTVDTMMMKPCCRVLGVGARGIGLRVKRPTVHMSAMRVMGLRMRR